MQWMMAINFVGLVSRRLMSTEFTKKKYVWDDVPNNMSEAKFISNKSKQ